MTNIAKCLNGLVEGNRLSREQAEKLMSNYNREAERFAVHMTQSQAERMAAERIAKQAEEAAKRKKYVTGLQILATRRVIGEVKSHPEGATAGALAHLTKDMHGAAKHSNVEYRKESILGQFHRMFGDGIAAMRAKAAGLREDRATQRDFIRALYSEQTGNDLAEAAGKAWRETAEYARTRFNRAGGDVKKRSDWHVPQTHDRARIQRVGQARWVEFMSGLDIEIRDPETGGVVEKGLFEAQALHAIWETLASGGANQRVPGQFVGGKWANRHADPRLIQFKSADAWLAYNDEFGAGHIYSLLTGHLDEMARDIALVEILGPHPDAMVKQMRDLAQLKEDVAGILDASPNAPLERSARAAANPLRLARRTAERPAVIEHVFNVVSGKASAPESQLVAAMFGGLRNLLSVAQLGSAPISAISDLKFLQKTASWNGIPAMQVMRRSLRMLNPAKPADRAFAARAGLIAAAWTSRAVSAKRFQDEVVGSGWTARLADFSHRISGLTPWTQANKWAFGLEFMGALADASAHAFDDLHPPIRRALESYGIDASLWDKARSFEALDFDGARFMNAADMARSSDHVTAEAGRRIHEMVLTETDFAVPEPDARVRAMLTQGTRRGTLTGELWRSLVMYKSFSVTVLTTHLMRGLSQATAGAKGLYTADLIIGLTVMGGVALQLKQIASGKDPRDMSDPAFLPAAFMQGGGSGIFGDFIAGAISRKGDDLVKTLMGPVPGLLTDVIRLSSGNARQFFDGTDTNFGSEAARFVQRYIPGSNLWYTKLAAERLIFDRLQMLADPRAARQHAKLVRKAEQEYGQTYWWKPGAAAPDHIPAFGDSE